LEDGLGVIEPQTVLPNMAMFVKSLFSALHHYSSLTSILELSLVCRSCPKTLLTSPTEFAKSHMLNLNVSNQDMRLNQASSIHPYL
jgi:hypothetical protein